MMAWLKSKFLAPPPSNGSDAKYFAALSAAEDLLIANRSLQQQLRPFRNMPDPFAAIQKAARISDEFEAPQEAKIFKGRAV